MEQCFYCEGDRAAELYPVRLLYRLQERCFKFFGSVSFKKKLEQADLTEFPCRILLDMKDSLRSGEQTEMLLRESIALGEDEYFVSEDSAFYKSVRGLPGVLESAHFF